MSAVGNGRCSETMQYGDEILYCILPKGHEQSGFPHRTGWVDGHQHNWHSPDGDETIMSKEGQPITNIGNV